MFKTALQSVLEGMRAGDDKTVHRMELRSKRTY
jgi:hypothetical protein